MAIYYLSASKGSRSGGQSAAAKFQYITRSGRYAAGQAEIVTTMSGNLPCWAEGPAAFWAAADQHERANGRLFRSYVISLPRELGPPEWQALSRSLTSQICGQDRLPWSAAIHAGDGANPHLHLVINERVDDGIARDGPGWFRRAALAGDDPASGGARKTQRLEKKKFLHELRKSWAGLANTALAEAGHTARIDHRTLEAQRQEAEAAGDHAAAEALDRLPVHQSRASIALEDADPDERPGTMPRKRRRRRPAATAPGRRARQRRRGNDQHRQLLEETRCQAQRMQAKAAGLKRTAIDLEARLWAAQQEKLAPALEKAQQQKEDEEYRAWLARLPQKLARLRDEGRYRGPDAPKELHIVSHPVFVPPVFRALARPSEEGVIDRAAMDDDEAPHLVGRWMRWLGRVTEPVFTPPGERQERVLLQAVEARRAAGKAVEKAEREGLVLVPTNRQAEALSVLGEAQGHAVLTFGQVAQEADLQRLAWRVDELLLPFPEADQPRELRAAIAGRERAAPDRKRAAAMRRAVENDRIAAAAAGWRGRDKTALHWAAAGGDAGTINRLILAGADVNARDRLHTTPLHLAASLSARPEIITALIELGADVHARDRDDDRTPLHWAAQNANPAPIVRRLIEHGADPRARDKWCMTPLHTHSHQTFVAKAARFVGEVFDAHADTHPSITPVRHSDPEAIKALIRAGADPDAIDDHGNTPLHMAAGWWGKTAQARALLEAAANVNAVNDSGSTPLHQAALRKNAGMVAMLIDAHADLFARDRYGMTPLEVARQKKEAEEVIEYLKAAEAAARNLAAAADPDPGDKVDDVTSALAAAELHHAARRGNTPRINELLADGADVNARDEHGRTALHLAASHDNHACIARLRADGSDIDARDEHGSTPLIAAARHGAEQAVTTLIELGADPSIRNKDDATALEAALDVGNAKVVETLLEACGMDGRTPLHLAVLRSDLAAVTKLLGLGADVNAKDWHRRTPLHLAASAEVATCLLARKANRNIKDNEGRTPLHLAALHGNAEVAARLVADKRLPMNARDKYGHTPQYYAARRGDTAMVDLLINRQRAGGRLPPGSHALVRLAEAVAAGDVNSRDGHGEIPPHQVPAAAPTPEIITVQGETQTPLRHAVGNDKTPAVAGTVAGQDPAGLPDPNARNEDGWTTLHEAAMNDNPDEITRLIAAGADVNAANHDGKTPLEVARVQSYSPEVIEALEAATNLPATSPPPARPGEIAAPAAAPDSPSTPSM